MGAPGIPLKAGTDINPARFCTLSVTENHTVNESNLNDTKLIGISAESTKNAPQTGGSTLHAEDGDHVFLHHFGEICKLKIGSGGCTCGDFLKPDGDGKGITASTGAVAGAQALESASEGELAEVLVTPPLYVA